MNPQTTRVFNNGNSQAVRIPQAFRFDTSEVEISRTENGDILLRPLRRARGDALLAILNQIDDADFIAELEQNQREQAAVQERDPL